ncbi:MAG: hypothetical protein M3O71_26350 [Bacteroidota bacterium]|nr:hypothetical protein [Bacteroidota bacterium]
MTALEKKIKANKSSFEAVFIDKKINDSLDKRISYSASWDKGWENGRLMFTSKKIDNPDQVPNQ